MGIFNGNAKFTDFDGYLSWYKNLSREDAIKTESHIKDLAGVNAHDRQASDVSAILYDMFHNNGIQSEENWVAHRATVVGRIEKFYAFATEFEQPVCVGHWEENVFSFLYIGNSKRGIIVPEPEKYLEYIPANDYSGMTPYQVRSALGFTRSESEMGIVPADAEQSLTVVSLEEQLEGQVSEINNLEQQMDDVRNARSGELAQLQRQMEQIKAELDKKKAALMAELNQRKAEMELLKEQLEGQIYLLDSQIYAIRCYAGEVVKFAKICSGKSAPDDEPIVIHQKLRFLDEDLGQLASLYEIQWNEMGMFEEFLRHSPIALDTFAPNERCVMLVRLSKTGKQLGEHDQIPCQNMLKDYEYYHGRTVGIIIRNGENVYLGWTDEDRVHIDDDLIVSQVITDTQPCEPDFRFESERERFIKAQKAERKRLLDGLVSRSFIYNILQGIVDNSDILPLPKGVTLGKQSEYVLYSVADKWLTDNRFGGFNAIIKRCNETVQKGDTILTVQRLVPERERTWGDRWSGGTWDNVRGRGERNRTHDCSVDDCTLYPVNLVEYDEPVAMVRYRWKDTVGGSFRDVELVDGSPAEPVWRENTREKNSYLGLDDKYKGEVLEEWEYRKRHVFVSVEKKDGYWRDTESRANFEVYDNEFINLTYLNSTWLEYVITNKTLGGWTIGGKAVDYAYAIRYLKTAMDHIRKREDAEKTLLDAVNPPVCRNPEWPLRLSEWKMKKGVRTITEYQARRYAKYHEAEKQNEEE